MTDKPTDDRAAWLIENARRLERAASRPSGGCEDEGGEPAADREPVLMVEMEVGGGLAPERRYYVGSATPSVPCVLVGFVVGSRRADLGRMRDVSFACIRAAILGHHGMSWEPAQTTTTEERKP